MKKFLLSIFAVMLAVFSVQAEEYSYTFTSKQFSANGTKTLNSVNWTLAGGGNYWGYDGTKGQQFGSGNAPYKSLTLSTSDIKGTITKIVINTSGASSVNASFTVSVGGTQYGNSTKLTTSATNYTFEGSASGEIKFSYTQTSSKAIYIKSIAVTYESAGSGEGGGETPEPDQPETPVAPAAPTLTASCNFDNSMTVNITVEEGATAYYSLNNETDWVEGSSVNITETTTVYAKAVKDGLSSGAVSATYTKNTPVTPPAEGEVVDKLTRELTGIAKNAGYSTWTGKTATSSAVYAGQSAGSNDAIQLKSKDSTSGIVTTKSGGKAKKVVVEWQSATSSGRILEVYGKNSAYSAATDLYNTSTQGTLLGTIVYGTSTELVIEGDYEYIGMRSESGAMYLTSISITWDASAGVTPVAPNAPVLTESQTFKGSLEVTITSDATVYYTTDGTTPSKTNGTVYIAPFEITATTTVKAVAVNEVGESDVAEATYTLFVVEETEGYYIKVASEPADWSGKYLVVYEEGADAYVFNGKDEANGYVSATIDGGVIKANGELDAVAVTIAAMEGGYSISTVSGYMYKTAYSNGVDFGETAKAANTFEIAEDGVVITSGNNEDKTTFRYNKAVDQMRFRYYKSGQQPVQLYKYVTELPSHQLSVTNAGYATLFLDFNAAIPTFEGEDAGAYIVTGVKDGNWLNLEKVEGVLPANTGIIVKANEGKYTFNYAAVATADVEDNLLAGSVENTYVEGAAYVLGYDVNDTEKETVVFAPAKLTEGKWLNNANKAYLPVSALSAGSDAPYYSFRFEDGTTGISEVKGENGEVKAIYDLTGRKLKSENGNLKGVYIVNGKKVLVK